MTNFQSVRSRIIVAGIALLLCFCYLGVMLYHVQITRHEELLGKARVKYTAKKKISGKRGEIYDRDGNLLVANQPCMDIAVDPSIANDDRSAEELTAFFQERLKDIKGEKLLKQLKSREIISKQADGTIRKRPRQYVLVASYVKYEDADKVRKEVQNQLKEELAKKRKFQDKRIVNKWKSISFIPKFKRVYPKRRLCANILGFTKIERGQFYALSGLEQVFNEKMTGDDGYISYERNLKGIPISFGSDSLKEEKDGCNIYLTISEPIQAIMEEELDKAVAQFKPMAAYAVMADPYGNILAASQRPTFDPEDISSRTAFNVGNMLALNAYEPGSVMKALTVSAALDCGAVTPDTIIDCEKNAWAYAGKRLRDTHYIGKRTVHEIIRESSNIGTAKMALMVGPERLDEYFRKFGIGSRTGSPFHKETKGRYDPIHKWGKIGITRISIGHSVSVSPLQLVRAYCMIANGGHPVKLNLLDHVQDPETGKIMRHKQEIPPSIFRNPATHLKVRSMLKSVVAKGGTGTKAAVPGYHVAGKTGTAHKVVNRQYSNTKYVGSFVGFAPADNPRFVLMVSIDEPDKKLGHFGGTVAGPAFSKIAERTLKYMGVPQDYEIPDKKKARGKAGVR